MTSASAPPQRTPLPFRATYDVWFAVPGVAERPKTLFELGRHIGNFLGGTALISADAGYLRTEDSARFALRLDPRAVTGTLLADLERAARNAGSPGVGHGNAPCGLPGPAEEFLAACSPAIRDLPTPDHPGVLLAEALGLAEERRPSREFKPPRLRYRRGDEWLPGRLCRIGEDGALIAAAAPPRVGDRLEVELSTPGGPLIVPAVASHVASDRAAAALGSAGFSARFAFASTGEFRAATPVIHGLRRRLSHSELPPRRRELRYPLRWPAAAIAENGRDPIWIRDISHSGLFAEGLGLAVGADTVLEVGLDEGTRIRLRGHVTRTTKSGCGVKLTSMAPDVSRSYESFVERVGARTARRLMVGAAARRLDELADALRSAGYAVSSASATRELCERAFEGRERPDLVLVDASLDGGGARRARALGRALAARQVEALHIDGETAAAARRLIDAALIG